jgi:hypothetical protein
MAYSIGRRNTINHGGVYGSTCGVDAEVNGTRCDALTGCSVKAKAIAFMYQHEETTVMDIVRNALDEHDRTVLANIHDAIIVKQKLSANLKNEIELRMQEQTQNPYWQLGVKELKGYESSNKEAKLEEAKHKKRMQQLEADAVGYKSPFTNRDSNP